MFNFGGIQRSYSYSLFHSDIIGNSLTATVCPTLECEWTAFKNSPDSTGNVFLGSNRLAYVGSGIVLEPGKGTGWIPANNLNLFWHKESDETTTLEYMVIGPYNIQPDPVILIETSRSPLLLEDGSRIKIYG